MERGGRIVDIKIIILIIFAACVLSDTIPSIILPFTRDLRKVWKKKRERKEEEGEK